MFKKITHLLNLIPVKVYIAFTIVVCAVALPITVVDGYNIWQNHVAEVKIRKVVSRRIAGYKAYEKDLSKPNPANDLSPMDSTHKTVYIAVQNPILKKQAIKAIHAWNNTGAVDFKYKVINYRSKIKNRSYKIVISEYHLNGISARRTKTLAYTRQDYNVNSGLTTGGNIKLNTTKIMQTYIYKIHFTNSNIRNIVEHELGHMVGLQHRQDKKSVMYPYDGKYDITKNDVKDAKLLYDTKADN